MGRRKRKLHSSGKKSIEYLVGNEKNVYPIPDRNKTMINVTNESSDTHKKYLSMRKSWKRSLRNS
jgi:hypothetical protein